MRRISYYPGLGVDIQQLPPRGWCPLCGKEIYSEGHEYCRRCEELMEEEEEDEYEDEDEEPMSPKDLGPCDYMDPPRRER